MSEGVWVGERERERKRERETDRMSDRGGRYTNTPGRHRREQMTQRVYRQPRG